MCRQSAYYARKLFPLVERLGSEFEDEWRLQVKDVGLFFKQLTGFLETAFGRNVCPCWRDPDGGVFVRSVRLVDGETLSKTPGALAPRHLHPRKRAFHTKDLPYLSQRQRHRSN